MSIQFNNLLPTWLTVLVTIALFAAMVYGTITLLRKQIARDLVITLSSLRFGIFLFFLLILLQPATTYSSSVAQLPELIVMVDTAQSMGKASNKETRLQEVTATLQKGDLAAALKGRYQLHWFAFDSSVKPIQEADLASLKASGSSAQFAETIDAACTQVRAFGKNPQRLLLVSDGIDRSQADPVETARRFGIAVDVLGPNAPKSDNAPPVTIAEVQSARRVLLGSDTIFRVTLNGKVPASKDRPLVVRVNEDDKKILDHPLVLKAGRVEQTLEFSFRPATVGLKQYQFILTNGTTTAKPYPLAVQVLDSKYEVLILEDRWRWDYKYLHRLFEDDPSFRFSALLNRGGGAFVQFGSPDRRVNLVGFPQSRADLEGFDTFVLGDVNASKWPRGLANDLARLISDDGRSLVVVAGPGLANLLEIPELHAILPVELTPDSGKPLEGPLDVRMRSDSGSSPFFFQLRSGDAEKLTPLDQIYPVLRKRPGATVLLEAAKERNPYGNRIVIAEHTVGRGRVLFIGTDTLWKWHTLAQTNEGPTPYSIFWQQAFRAMTPARSNVGSVNLWLTPNRSRAEVGRPIVIQAEVQSSRTLPPATMQAFVTTPDDKRLPLVFTVDPANPRLYRTEFSCTQAGLQRISASLTGEGKMLAEAATSIQVDEPSGEDGDVDLANLARIAHDTGGKVIDPTLPETWPMPGDVALPPIQRLHTIDLWNNFTLLLILCVLLGADWFIRLFKGLVSG
jgi:hypothetical protein